MVESCCPLTPTHPKRSSRQKKFLSALARRTFLLPAKQPAKRTSLLHHGSLKLWYWRQQFVAGLNFAFSEWSCWHLLQGEIYEYLDNFVLSSVDCMDWWLHRFSCCRRLDPPVADSCGDISDTSFCSGKKSCIGVRLRKIYVPLPKPMGAIPPTNAKGIMTNDTLKDLYVEELKDIYSAENQIIKALPKMVKAASSEALKAGFEEHLQQTKVQVERLQKIFALLDEAPTGKKCHGMEGLLEEGSEAIEEFDGDVLDAALISAAQQIGRAHV